MMMWHRRADGPASDARTQRQVSRRHHGWSLALGAVFFFFVYFFFFSFSGLFCLTFFWPFVLHFTLLERCFPFRSFFCSFFGLFFHFFCHFFQLFFIFCSLYPHEISEMNLTAIFFCLFIEFYRTDWMVLCFGNSCEFVYIDVCMCVCVYIDVCMCVYVCIRSFLALQRTHIHTYTHTYIYIHKLHVYTRKVYIISISISMINFFILFLFLYHIYNMCEYHLMNKNHADLIHNCDSIL